MALMETGTMALESEEDFEKLILAYDICMRKNSRFEVLTSEEQLKGDRFA